MLVELPAPLRRSAVPTVGLYVPISQYFELTLFAAAVSAFVAPASGQASLALPRLLQPELNVTVRTALIEAKRRGQPVRRERVPLGEAAGAMQRLFRRQVKGKVVVLPEA